MNVYTVAFFGHRHIDDHRAVRNKLEALIRKLICEHDYVDFLVGRNGDFDQLVSSCVRCVRKTYGKENSSLVLVLPYLTADYMSNTDGYEAYYDDIELDSDAALSHCKSAIGQRNRHLAERADLVVSYIDLRRGGAYTAVKYAEKLGKTVVNLGFYTSLSAGPEMSRPS